MGAGRFVVLRKAADQLNLELVGELDEPLLRECVAETRAQVIAARPAGVRVLVDLTGVEGYSLEARDALTALQKHLDDKTSQTAYVATSAAGRGLALWVIHMTEAQVIKCFARRADAEAWLGGSAGPSTGVRPVARAREPERQRAQKKALG
jgi:hypothetical protein